MEFIGSFLVMLPLLVTYNQEVLLDSCSLFFNYITEKWHASSKSNIGCYSLIQKKKNMYGSQYSYKQIRVQALAYCSFQA